jgi:RNA polymerase sigma-70 factor (ECF subfamily)
MGNCKEIFALLSEYLDGELKAGSCEEIQRHIAGCAPCIEFLESLKKTIALCHEVQPREAAPPLDSSVLAQLKECYRQGVSSAGEQN